MRRPEAAINAIVMLNNRAASAMPQRALKPGCQSSVIGKTKMALPSVQQEGGGPPGGRGSSTAWGLQQLVMENHSAIRGLKISHRGACALLVDYATR